MKSKQRIKETGEVFTPPELVQKMLDNLDIDWSNPPQNKTFLDPTCGDGNFLVELYNRGIPPENIYGVDLMFDNIEQCKYRMPLVPEKNLVQANALNFDYGSLLV